MVPVYQLLRTFVPDCMYLQQNTNSNRMHNNKGKPHHTPHKTRPTTNSLAGVLQTQCTELSMRFCWSWLQRTRWHTCTGLALFVPRLSMLGSRQSCNEFWLLNLVYPYIIRNACSREPAVSLIHNMHSNQHKIMLQGSASQTYDCAIALQQCGTLWYPLNLLEHLIETFVRGVIECLIAQLRQQLRSILHNYAERTGVPQPNS